MKETEFLKAVGSIDEKYIEEAEAKTKKKSSSFLKYGSLAACLCLCAVLAASFGKTTNLEKSVGKTEETQGAGGMIERTEPVKPETDDIESDRGNIISGIPDESFPVPQEENTPQSEGNLPFISYQQTPSSVENATPKYTKIFEGFAGITEGVSVKDGEVWMSPGLMKAMEEYTDTTRYRLLVKFFKDGTEIDSGTTGARNEVDRLGKLGYEMALQNFFDGKENHYTISLIADYENLLSFKGNEYMGTALMLYNEGFAEDPAAGGDAVVYNGAMESEPLPGM